jgi:hypothetical protein
MAMNMGDDIEMDRLYKINTESDNSVFRLFVKGSHSPYMLDEDGFDLQTWISMKSEYTPKSVNIFHLSDDTHPRFVKMTKHANAFTMLYIPQNPRSQNMYSVFAKVADLFKVIILLKLYY